MVLIAGFLVLALSGFKVNRALGLLTIAIIAMALIADFLLLPPLLMKLEGMTPEELEDALSAEPSAQLGTSTDLNVS